MKILKIATYLFLLIGGLAVLGAVISYQNTQHFIASAKSATGVVVDLQAEVRDNSTTLRPVVVFRDDNGKPVRFSSSVSSYPPAYQKGESVTVMYPPNQPEDARIDSFSEHWAVSLVLLVVGLPFLLIGLLMMLFGLRRKRNKEYLHKNGIEVQADLQEVRRNRTVSVNGNNPFVIVCHWVNPQTSQFHVFESENIWFEPSRYINGEKIRVLLDERNSRNYHVDISFLPNVVV